MPWICFQCDKWTSFPTLFALSSRIGEGNSLRAGQTGRSRLETLAPFRSKGAPARGTGVRPPAPQKRGPDLAEQQTRHE
jgi:hypothetical protein